MYSVGLTNTFLLLADALRYDLKLNPFLEAVSHLLSYANCTECALASHLFRLLGEQFVFRLAAFSDVGIPAVFYRNTVSKLKG